MTWDREKRGIFQRKQEKPQIKKHKPLNSEGNDGDFSIRQTDEGVFLYFKALGRWYKTLNASSKVIPESSGFVVGEPDNPINSLVVSGNSIYIGDTKSEQGAIRLEKDSSSGIDYLSFRKHGATKSTTLVEEEEVSGSRYIDLGGLSGSAKAPIFALPSGTAAGMFKYGGGVHTILSFDTNNAQVNIPKGVLKFTETTAPSGGAIPGDGAGILFLDTSDNKLKYQHASLNSGNAIDLTLVTTFGSYLPLAGGTLTGKTAIDIANTDITLSTDGHVFDTDTTIFNDATTSASGTASSNFYAYRLNKHALTATNSSVTTPTAATLLIGGETLASTNQTITNNYALQISQGNVKLPDDGKIIFGDAGEYIKGDGTDLTITSSGDILLDADGGDVTIQDSGSSTPRLKLHNTSDAYGTPPVITFETRPSNDVGTVGDDIGRIDFNSDDAGGNVTTYAQILGEIAAATDGQEGGKLSFKVSSHDAESVSGLVLTDGDAEDEIDIAIGSGTSSVITVAGHITMPNDGKVTFGDADEYIKGDGTDLIISSTSNVSFNGSRLIGAARFTFNDGGATADIIRDEDDMTSNDANALATQQSIKAYVDNTIRDIKSSGFNYSYTAGTKVYIPLGSSTGESSSTSGGNDYRHFVVPFDGYLDQVVFRSEEACGSTIVGFHKSSTGVEVPSSTASATVTVDMTTDDTAYKFDFTSSNTFSAGDIIAISFDPTNDANDTNATVVLVYDGSQGV